MRNRVYAGLLVLASFFGVAAAADAATMPADFVRMGVEFWQARDVAACPAPVLVLTDEPGGSSDAGGAAALGGCVIELRSGLVLRAARERWRPGYGGDSAREELCATVFHELGHTAGLGHTDTGLMSTVSTVVPDDCEGWVAKRVRAERRAYLDRLRGIARTAG